MLRELCAEEILLVSGGNSEDGNGEASPKKDKRVDPDSSGGGASSGDGAGSSSGYKGGCQIVGGLTGAALGGITGAAVGSVAAPPAGTVAGAVMGAVAGASANKTCNDVASGQ